MIPYHQPTIFGTEVVAALSSKSDGNMKFGVSDDMAALANRERFLRLVKIDPRHTTLVGVTYSTDDFTKYRIAKDDEKNEGMLVPLKAGRHTDALVVDRPGHALFLPLADCVGAIIYDDAHGALMVSHLGRHSVEADGVKKCLHYLQTHYRADPARLRIWLSPGVGSASYPLHTFDGKSLHEVITRQLIDAGVSPMNIENSGIDTAVNDEYYSHSEFLKGNEPEPGRFAIVAMMAARRSEPAS